MDERVVQFRVGVMVLATAIITAILVVLFGKLPTLVRGTYTVLVQFQDATGVSQDTPVRESGILIGRVAKTELNDQGVLVVLQIHSDVKLTKRESVRVEKPLLGDTSLHILKNFNDNQPPEPVQSGDYMVGTPAPDPYKIVIDLEKRMDTTIVQLGSAGEEVAHLAHNVNNLIEANDEQFNRIIVKTERALDSFQRAMASVDEFVSDDQLKADLKRSIAAVPKILGEAEATIGVIRETVSSAKETVQGATRVVNNVEKLTAPLAAKGSNIVENMDSSVSHLNGLLNEVEMFTKNLNSNDGTLSQLLKNPRLYEELEAAAQNVKSLTSQLKPIVGDARVFTDKIARHPGILLRDAISPGAGVKGPSPRSYFDLDKYQEVSGDPP